MQYLWLAMASAGVVAAVGAVVGVGRSTGSVQKRAVALSFGVLGFTGIVACAIVMTGLVGFAGAFALLIVAFPLATYALVVAIDGSECKRKMRSHPIRRGAIGSAGKRVVRPSASTAVAPERHATASAPEVRRRVERAETPVDPAGEENRPVRDAVPVQQAAYAPAPAPMPASAPLTPAPAPSAPEFARSLPPAPKPTPNPAPTPTAPPVSSACETYFEKAAHLKDAGALLAAARLFAESAAQADGSNARRRARFEELSCYVKAGAAERAHALARDLREQTGVMTKVERIKLDAVLRML